MRLRTYLAGQHEILHISTDSRDFVVECARSECGATFVGELYRRRIKLFAKLWREYRCQQIHSWDTDYCDSPATPSRLWILNQQSQVQPPS
jgi:hypothetical protein